MSVDHYENFPVASWLCPPALRPPIVAIYRFARTSDDLADEGEATAPERVADLDAYRADLLAVAAARPPSPRWADVFAPLGGPSPGIACRCAPRRPARRLPPGRAADALRRSRRAARLLPALGESDRPVAAAPLRHRRRPLAGAIGCDLQRPAARQFLAGPRCRCRPRPALRARRRRASPRRRQRRAAGAPRQRPRPRARWRARRLGTRADADRRAAGAHDRRSRRLGAAPGGPGRTARARADRPARRRHPAQPSRARLARRAGDRLARARHARAARGRTASRPSPGTDGS